MKKLFFFCIIFACTTVYAQNEIWTVKKTVSEVFIEDGDTITEEFVDEFSLALSESGTPLSFFLGMSEDWLIPENAQGVISKEKTANFAGFIKLTSDISYKELYDMYGAQLGSRSELSAALANPIFDEFFSKLENSEDVMAVTLVGVSEKIQTTRKIVSTPRSQMSHFKNENKETYYVPHDGTGAYAHSDCNHCHQTLYLERVQVGNESHYEIFFINNTAIQYNGWVGENNIIPKNTWIFVTRDDDPYLWD